MIPGLVVPGVFVTVLAFLFGLLIGSFLNVCIYRWPRDLSVVTPRSRCPECEAPIAAYHNVPLLSYLLLRGRCRNCAQPISWRYPLVELLTASTFCYFILVIPSGPLVFKYCVLSCLLIGLIFADLETLILPDQFTVGGLVLGLMMALAIPVPDSTFQLVTALLGFQLPGMLTNLGEALLGALLPAGILWLGGWVFEKVRHKEGLGFGDVKMIAMVGSFLGLRGCLLTILLGSVLGSLIGITYIYLAKKDPADFQLPFASFLGIGAFLAMVQGQNVFTWYTRLIS